MACAGSGDNVKHVADTERDDQQTFFGKHHPTVVHDVATIEESGLFRAGHQADATATDVEHRQFEKTGRLIGELEIGNEGDGVGNRGR